MNGLDDLLNQFGPTPEEKRQALKQALIVSGLGLLGTPKGQEWRGIGRAGLLGVGDYNEQLQQGALQKGRNMLLAEKAMEMRDKQAEREARAAQAKQQQEAFNALMSMPGAIEGAAPAAGQANGIPAPFQQPGGAAALVNKELGIQVPEQTQLPTAPAIAAQQTAIGGGQSDKLMAQANYLEEVARATRNPTALVMAQKMRDDAMKLRLDELKTREEFTAPMVGIGPDGKPTYFRPGKWGSNRPVSEVRPPQDIKIEDFGGSKRAVDLLTTAPGTMFEKTMTPGEAAANEVARGHLGIAGANLGLARERLAMDKAKPTETPAEKPLTESQATKTIYLGMMKSASKDIDAISGLNNAEISLARGDAKYLPQWAQNLMSSDKAQKYVQSSMQWTEAMLRITTGATAPPEELARMSKMYFPQVGDSASVILQKKQRRDNMEQFVGLAAGRGAGQVEEVLKSDATATTTAVTLPNGKVVRFQSAEKAAEFKKAAGL